MPDYDTMPQRTVLAPILMYHHIGELPEGAGKDSRDWSVSPKAFDQQMEWLHKHGYHAVTPQKISEYLRSGAPLPAKPVVISFDDGWIEQYSMALPILRRHGLSATFFIYPGGIGSGNGDGVSMTWTQLADLLRQGMDIEAHSVGHPDLTKAKPEEARREIIESKAILESHLGRPITAFAYPFGKYDDAVVGIVRSAGYRCAVGIDEGATQTTAGLFSMTRLHIAYNDSLDDFAARIQGHARAGR